MRKMRSPRPSPTASVILSHGAFSSSWPLRSEAVPAGASSAAPFALISASARRLAAWLLAPAHQHAEPLRWDHRRSLWDFLVCSNMAYAVVGAVYARKGLPARGAIVALSGVTSGAYHLSRETVAGAPAGPAAGPHPGRESALRQPPLPRVASGPHPSVLPRLGHSLRHRPPFVLG